MSTKRGVPLPAQRGTIYWADLGSGRKPWVIVSNNGRNGAMGSYLAVRITTTSKPSLISIVELSAQDPLTGRVLCDDIAVLYDEDLEGFAGAVTISTLGKVSAGLRAALAL